MGLESKRCRKKMGIGIVRFLFDTDGNTFDKIVSVGLRHDW